MPIIATTIMSSMRVNPACLDLIVFAFMVGPSVVVKKYVKLSFLNGSPSKEGLSCFELPARPLCVPAARTG